MAAGAGVMHWSVSPYRYEVYLDDELVGLTVHREFAESFAEELHQQFPRRVTRVVDTLESQTGDE